MQESLAASDSLRLPSPDRDEVHAGFSWVFRALRRRLGLVFCSTFLIASVLMFFVYRLEPLYTSETHLLSVPRDQSVVELRSLLRDEYRQKAWVDNQIFILRSEKVLRRTAIAESLVEDPEFNPSLRPPGLMDALYAWIADPPSSSVDGKAGASAEDERKREERRLLTAIDILRDKIDVALVDRSRVLQVSVTTRDPDKSARLANELSRAFIDFQRENKFEKTRDTIRWLNARLTDLRDEVAASEKAVADFRIAENLQNPKGVELSEEELSTLNSRLILLRAEREEKHAKYMNALRIRENDGDLAVVADVADSVVIGDLRREEAEILRKEAELSIRYGSRHPEIINIRAERQDVRRQIELEMRRGLNKLKNDYDIALGKEKALEQSLRAIKAKSGDDKRKTIQLRELERLAESNRSLYQTFLARYKETEKQEELEESDFTVLGVARPDPHPSYPDKPLFLQVILAFSGLCGVSLAFLLESMSRRFWFAADIEERLGFPCIAEVPLIEGGGRRFSIDRLFDDDPCDGPHGSYEGSYEGNDSSLPQDHLVFKPFSMYGEAIRSLRTFIQLQPPRRDGCRVVMVTSTVEMEGKTTIAVSLARSAAMGGMRTLIIDLDLRRGVIGRTLDPRHVSEGMVAFLRDQTTLNEAIVVDPKTSLDVLPIHGSTNNPTGLLDSPQLQKLLETVKENYDFIVVDTSPLMPISDTMITARLEAIDQVVFVVGWNKTPFQPVERAFASLHGVREKIVGVALNKVDVKKQMRGVYGDGKYYYRSYDSPYYEED